MFKVMDRAFTLVFEHLPRQSLSAESERGVSGSIL